MVDTGRHLSSAMKQRHEWVDAAQERRFRSMPTAALRRSELARELGVSPAAVSSWARRHGRSEVSSFRPHEIADYYLERILDRLTVSAGRDIAERAARLRRNHVLVERARREPEPCRVCGAKRLAYLTKTGRKHVQCGECRNKKKRLETELRKTKKLRVCKRCETSKSISAWPRSPNGTLAGTCGCYWATPQRRAEQRVAKIERQRAERAAFARGLGRVVGQPDATRFDAHVLAFRAQEAKRSRAKHNAHVVAYSRWLKTADGYRWRYRNNPEFAIKERLRRQLRKKAEGVPGLAEAIRQAIKHGKSPSSKVETALGYSVAELKVHIERQFTKGMSWDAWTRGGIHIDHILPRKCFDVATMEGIRAYWALSNLRPLWAKHNLQKLDKVQFLL